MNEQRTKSDPIYPIASFTDRAIPLSGALKTQEMGGWPTRAINDPIHPLITVTGPVQPLTPIAPADELQTTIWQQLRAISASNLSPTDAILVRSWLDGRAEQDVAAELAWSADAVRAARSRLLSRVRVTIDSTPT